MQHGQIRVKWQYQNERTAHYETVGNLALDYARLAALVGCLRAGNADVELTGPYIEQSPHIAKVLLNRTRE